MAMKKSDFSGENPDFYQENSVQKSGFCHGLGLLTTQTYLICEPEYT